MKASRLVSFVLLFLSCCLTAQAFQTSKSIPRPTPALDVLAEHRSAAETFQISGDLENARVENLKVVSIGLRSLADTVTREGDLRRAAKILAESINVRDSLEARTSLAIVHMQLGELDEGIAQADYAVSLGPQNPEALDALAKLLYLKADYARALPTLERLFGLQPNFDSAYTLGMTYLHLKELNRAKLLFEEMLTAVTKKAPLHMLLGKAYETTNYPLEAEREFRNAIRADPKLPGAHFYLGFTILQHGGSERLDEASKEFDLELGLSPRDPYPNFFAGVVASSLADHSKAVRFLQTTVRLKPDLGSAHLFLGQSQMELGDDAAAEASLRKAITLNKDPSTNSFQIRRAYFLLGRLLTKMGRKVEGEKNLAKAQELQGQMLESARDDIRRIFGEVVNAAKPAEAENVGAPKRPAQLPAGEAAALKQSKDHLTSIVAQAYHNLAVIEAQKGLIDEGLARFAAASAWKQDFPGLDRNWGIVLFRANKFDEAVGPLSRQLKLKSDDVLVRRMLGVSLYLTKKFGPAAATLKPIETTLAQEPELAYFYGVALVQLERHAEARVAFGRIAERNPKSAQAHLYAGQGLALAGDLAGSVTRFRAAANLDASLRTAHYSAGQALLRMNRLDEAEKEFRDELLIDPSNVLAKYHLAYTLIERKAGMEEAERLLREAIDAKYDYADARYQLGKVLIEKGAIAEAVEQLQVAANLDPKKEYIHYQLSIALRKASRTEEADRALKLYSELKGANRSDAPAGIRSNKNEP
jgi:tetratricopeptide (TPR) repeat protein